MEQLTNPEAEERAQLIEEIFKRPTVIGIEGGPCGGKTSFVESLKTIKCDRPIIVLPEAATQVIKRYQSAGFNVIDKNQEGDKSLHGCIDAQKLAVEIFHLTLQQIDQAKREYYGTNAVIVSDRVDCGACYIDSGDYLNVCQQAGIYESPSLEMVDKLLYFPTIAHKNPDAYMQLKHTNPARRETVEEAVIACNSTLEVAKSCTELHYIDFENFNTSLEVATQYVLNPDKEYEYGGFLVSAMQGAIWRQPSCRHLGTSYIEQSYHKLNGIDYRIREESIKESYSIRRTISLKNHTNHTERQRLISLQEADVLKRDSECSLSKTRERFLYTDPQTGITDVWCLDEIAIGKSIIWAFEVERHSEEALKTIHPPFEHYLSKFCSNHGLARLALMFS